MLLWFMQWGVFRPGSFAILKWNFHKRELVPNRTHESVREIGACRAFSAKHKEIAAADVISAGVFSSGITGALSVPRGGGKMNFLQGSIRLKNLGDKSRVVGF